MNKALYNRYLRAINGAIDSGDSYAYIPTLASSVEEDEYVQTKVFLHFFNTKGVIVSFGSCIFVQNCGVGDRELIDMFISMIRDAMDVDSNCMRLPPLEKLHRQGRHVNEHTYWSSLRIAIAYIEEEISYSFSLSYSGGFLLTWRLTSCCSLM